MLLMVILRALYHMAPPAISRIIMTKATMVRVLFFMYGWKEDFISLSNETAANAEYAVASKYCFYVDSEISN